MKAFAADREGYKKTELGWIPEDWEYCKLKEVILFISRGKSPTYAEKSEYSVINQKCIRWDSIDFNQVKYVSSEFWKNLKEEYKVKKNDCLINSTGTGTLGRAILFPDTDRNCTIDSHVTIVRGDIKKLENCFLKHFLISDIGQKLIYNECVTGSTNQVELNKNLFLELKLPLPPIQQQKKIAAILSTVDEKIDVIDAGINAAEKLKKALMRRLLTQGIGHSEFKETEIGQIPKEWKVVKLGNIVLKIMGGGTPSRENSNYYNGSIPWITVKDLSLDEIYKSNSIEKITEIAIEKSSSNLIEKDNIIISTRMGLGKGFINSVSMAINQDMKAIYVDKNLILNEFFLFWFYNNKDLFQKLGVGTTVKGISLTTLNSMIMPLPSKIEQKEISSMILSIFEKLDILREKKEAYQNLKKGLMQQLLTGAIRVNL